MISITDIVSIVSIYLINLRNVDVVKKLSKYGIIYFICYGILVTKNPSSTTLIFSYQETRVAERVTVIELRIIYFRKSQIAYLSTYFIVKNLSYKLSNKSIYLASTFQLADYLHIIINFWEVKDHSSIYQAGIFYQNLVKTIKKFSEFKNNHDTITYAFYNSLYKLH